jgi:hypothetical protein
METPTVETPVATPPPAPDPAPPPAATVVVNGDRDERVTDLERQLEGERTARRKAETDASYALDEARRLKEAQSLKPTPQPKPKSSPWTFMDDEED